MERATKTLTVEAYSFESRLPPRVTATWIEGVELEVRKSMLVGAVGGDGALFVFDFGSVVCVGVERARVDSLVDGIFRRLSREPHPPLRENFALEIDPSATGPRVSFDRVVLPALTPLDLECVATVLAQSVTIDYFTEDLESTLARVQEIAELIAKKGRLGHSRGYLAKFVAGSIASQVEMIHSIALLDKPDFTWEDEGAERLYDILRHHLEIQERHRALQIKLTTIRESLSQFLEMNTARRALLLETTVVLLILFEIVMGLVEAFGHD